MGKGIKKYRKALLRGYPKNLEKGDGKKSKKRWELLGKILSRYQNHR